MYKFKKGDEILITSGRDKGKKSKIDIVLTRENKVIATGINVYKRHKKVSQNKAAGIYEVNRPIDVSKIAIICPKCSKPTKVGFKIDGKTKQRTCKKCKGTI